MKISLFVVFSFFCVKKYRLNVDSNAYPLLLQKRSTRDQELALRFYRHAGVKRKELCQGDFVPLY